MKRRTKQRLKPSHCSTAKSSELHRGAVQRATHAPEARLPKKRCGESRPDPSSGAYVKANSLGCSLGAATATKGPPSLAEGCTCNVHDFTPLNIRLEKLNRS